MNKRTISTFCLAALTFSLAISARAQDNPKPAQVCAWIVETKEPNDVHHFALWLQADAELDFRYVIGGQGIVTESGKSHSPSSGTLVLHAGKAEKPWGFGTTMETPAKVDITVELRQTPADIFSKEATPLLAKFSFRREAPESEKSAPRTLAKKQCAVVKTEKAAPSE
jgi:hypothetical protein